MSGPEPPTLGGAFVMGMVIGIGIAAALVVCFLDPPSTLDRFKKQAIEHGFARFNETSGQWEWKVAEKKP